MSTIEYCLFVCFNVLIINICCLTGQTGCPLHSSNKTWQIYCLNSSMNLWQTSWYLLRVKSILITSWGSTAGRTCYSCYFTEEEKTWLVYVLFFSAFKGNFGISFPWIVVALIIMHAIFLIEEATQDTFVLWLTTVISKICVLLIQSWKSLWWTTVQM